MGLQLPVRDPHQPLLAAGSDGVALYVYGDLQGGADVPGGAGCRYAGGQRSPHPHPGGKNNNNGNTAAAAAAAADGDGDDGDGGRDFYSE